MDANTARAKAYLRQTGAPLFTALHGLEVGNAFKLGVFRRLLTGQEAAAAWANVERDLAARRLVKSPVNWLAVFRMAVRLSERHTAVTGTRSLDILHVAAARVLRTGAFVSFDTHQRALAVAAGLAVVA